MTVAKSDSIGPAVPTDSVALLRCIKSGQKIREGSRIPAALPASLPVAPFSRSAPSPTSTTTASTLLDNSNGRKKVSAGSIAGILVGLVVGGALIGGASPW